MPYLLLVLAAGYQ